MFMNRKIKSCKDSSSSKLIYRFNEISNQIPRILSWTWQSHSKIYIEVQMIMTDAQGISKAPRRQNDLLYQNFKILKWELLKEYALVHIQPNMQVEQKRELQNRPVQIWKLGKWFRWPWISLGKGSAIQSLFMRTHKIQSELKMKNL